VDVRVLVTGGSGFIGSHVVDRLLAHGHEPRIFDLVQPHQHDAPDVEVVIGDILDARAVHMAMRDCNAVVHLAAVADVDEVRGDPLHADLVNTRGTGLLLQAAREERVAQVVYASTIWVYGDAAGRELLDEEHLLPLPDHFYTATKLAGEMYCRAYGQLYGLAPTILRFGIPHGPRARAAAVVPRFVTRALNGEPLHINGDGNQSRQFVYVEDLAEGVVASLTPEAVGRTYNLVGDETVSVREIAGIVRRLVGDVEISHVPGRPGDLGRARISGRRALEELGWTASTPFEEGVRRYVSWLTGTNGSNGHRPAAAIDGREAAVLSQEPGAL
jgi:UDP-glucose 4-epimerase